MGDSITQGGAYVEFIDAALRAQHPETKIEIIPLGLSSETVSGLSEDGHAGGKFPRPDLHERLDRVLEKARPQLVYACYGMNDGIYYPLGDERFQAFKNGMKKLHDKVVATGARIVHLTPPVFDPVPIKARVLPAGLDKYEKPFEGYNTVLDAYAQWLLSMKTQGWEVLDIHGPFNAALAEKRKTDPAVHLIPKMASIPVRKVTSSWLSAVLKAWELKVKPDGTPDHVERRGASSVPPSRKKQGHAASRLAQSCGPQTPWLHAPGLPIA